MMYRTGVSNGWVNGKAMLAVQQMARQCWVVLVNPELAAAGSV